MSLKIISTFGDHSSLYPLAVKDIVNSLGMTAYSYESGGQKKEEKEVEAKDRFIDEFGTEAIWLGGLPFFKWLADKTIYKNKNLNPDIDVRLINNKEHLEVAKKYAKAFAEKLGKADIADDLLNAEKNSGLFKKLFYGKFGVATALTLASYFTLTLLKQNYTNKQVKKRELRKLAQEAEFNKNISQTPAFKAFVMNQNSNKEAAQKGNKIPSFKGFGSMAMDVVNKFAFNPVHNMFIVDTGITSERLIMARNKHEKVEYAIKEGSLLFFMYVAGKYVQRGIEYVSDKVFNRPIKLHAEFLSSDTFKNAINKNTVASHLNEFNNLKDNKAIYDFIYNESNAENLIVKAAKKSGIINVIDESGVKLNPLQKFINIFKIHAKPETGLVNPHQFIDVNELKDLSKNIEKFVQRQKTSGETVEQFLKNATKFKVGSVVANLGISCLFLGVIVPMMMKKYKEKYYGSGSHIQNGIKEQLEKTNFGQKPLKA